MDDKSCSSKKAAYNRIKQEVQSKTREMKNRWWMDKAMELQEAADHKDVKRFFENLKAVYGPKEGGLAPLLAADGCTLLKDRDDILKRWTEHFSNLLNRPSEVSEAAIEEIPQLRIQEQLSDPPNLAETLKAIKQMSNGKTPGADGIPSEVFKHGGHKLARSLVRLFNVIWDSESVPQEFKDANIIHLYKRKGNRSCCDNHRGISLLATGGKILARIIANRLSSQVAEKILPESQCGFRPGRGTVDMIFTARQIQEKCREQNRDLYMVFIDLTKAFDTVSRDALWQVLHKFGCPDKFVNIIKSFHEGMAARVSEEGRLSEPFEVNNGTKQGCVLAPLLFNIFYAAMLLDAFRNNDQGIHIRYRTDGGIFNLRRLQAKTKVIDLLARDLLYADDCALVAHTLEDAQSIVDCFARAATRFGLSINIKKTEVIQQLRSQNQPTNGTLHVDGLPLANVSRFCYLGSILSQNATIDDDITERIAKSSQAFGRLKHRLWDDNNVSLATKISVYRAVVMSTLLYGAEAWTLYRRHVHSLDQFHMRCLRTIAKIKWQDMIPNAEVLAMCRIDGIESFLHRVHLRWIGHILRMPNDRLPKAVLSLLYGQLADGGRNRGRPLKRYKDGLKATLQACSIDPSTWEDAALDRSAWRDVCFRGVSGFERRRVENLAVKRQKRKTGQDSITGDFVCHICGRRCGSRIGLHSHMRTHGS